MKYVELHRKIELYYRSANLFVVVVITDILGWVGPSGRFAALEVGRYNRLVAVQNFVVLLEALFTL